MEREELVWGGAWSEREVEEVLGGVELGACGEEERGREEGADWFGEEREGWVVGTRDACEAV